MVLAEVLAASPVVERRLRLTSLFLLALTVALSSPTGAQQRGVEGVIKDAETGVGIAGALVTVLPEGRSATTGAEGRFSLAGPLPSDAVIRVQRAGYVTEVHPAGASPSGASGAGFELALTPLATVLDELTVVALSDAPSQAQVLRPAGSRLSGSVADYLQGRAVGLEIRPRGVAGDRAGGVRIRGSSSISTTNEPLVFLDGIRIDTGILDDLPIADIESIEIIRGPEAMSYGLDSGHGVIVIKTISRASAPAGNP